MSSEFETKVAFVIDGVEYVHGVSDKTTTDPEALAGFRKTAEENSATIAEVMASSHAYTHTHSTAGSPSPTR